MKDKIIYYLLLFFLFAYSSNSQAQDSTATNKNKLHFGYNLYFNYNLYSWHQKPSTIYGERSSSGQAMNILPGVGAGFWVGNIKNWLLSFEAGIEYLPFEIDLQKSKGLGSLSFPLAAKLQFPVAKQQSTWIMLHLGAGCQIIKTDLYGRTSPYNSFVNPFYANVFGELGVHLSAVGYHYQHIREIEFFVRMGGGHSNSILFSTGLRLSFWNNLNKK